MVSSIHLSNIGNDRKWIALGYDLHHPRLDIALVSTPDRKNNKDHQKDFPENPFTKNWPSGALDVCRV